MSTDHSDTSSRQWRDREVRDVVSYLARTRSKGEFQRAQARLARKYDCTEKAVYRIWWGIGCGYRAWPPPPPVAVEMHLDEWRWGEIKLVELATGPDPSGVAEKREHKPTAEKLAQILHRAVADVAEAMVRYGPAKGRKGFGLA